MKSLPLSRLLALACLCAACGPAALSATGTAPAAATAPAAEASAFAPVATAAPGDYVLSLIPHCDSIERLDQPVAFAWPNVERRLEELAGSRWGYFACPQAAGVVSAYYQAQMPRPPYNMRENNWVEQPEGTLGVYYHSAYQVWAYLWVVPRPGGSGSYVIVAVADGLAFEPDC